MTAKTTFPASANKVNADIIGAVNAARMLAGTYDELGATTMAYPGPGQHRLVRDTLDEMGITTEKDIVRFSGAKTAKQLREIADGTRRTRADRKCLADANAVFNGYPSSTWQTGRHLASILFVRIMEIRAEDRAAKAAAKVEVVA